MFLHRSTMLRRTNNNLRSCKTSYSSQLLMLYSSTSYGRRKDHRKPLASHVLTCYLKQRNEPPWTSYFVSHKDIVNDQYGMSHFNWIVGSSNYTILRVGCFPYVKYHCTKAPKRNLDFEDKFYRTIKVCNLGIPCLLYGIAAIFLIKHKEVVHTDQGDIYIYFLLEENVGSRY